MLPPALQSYWMPVHVSSLLLSYVTLAVAYLACLIYFTLKLVKQWFAPKAPSSVMTGKMTAGMSTLTILAFLGFVFLVPFSQVVNIAVVVPVAGIGVWLAKTGRLQSLETWIDGFDKFSFAIFGIGFPFLNAGLMMGAFWAQEAWALYWGWDSKETSALISWLIYLVYMHLRFVAGWKGERGLWVILLGAVSILITFQLFGYLPASQDSLHKYTDGVSREGTELSGNAKTNAERIEDGAK
jgi:ABC-type transport system involved in cytochrome c biogenesis permease subunit